MIQQINALLMFTLTPPPSPHGIQHAELYFIPLKFKH